MVPTTFPVVIEWRLVPGGLKGSTSVRILRPIGITEAVPAILYIHGGGWTLGSRGTHECLLRQLVGGTNAAVILVNYTRPPEATYRVALQQSYATAKFVAERGATWNVDSTRIAVAGDGIGAKMAADVTLLCSRRGSPRFRYQMLFYPLAEDRMEIIDRPDHIASVTGSLVVLEEAEPSSCHSDGYVRKMTERCADITLVRQRHTIDDIVAGDTDVGNGTDTNVIALATANLKAAFAA